MSENYSTEYSQKKNINTLNKGSYTDNRDGTPAKQIKGTVELRDTLTDAPFAVAPSGAIETGELIRLAGGNFEAGTILAHKYEQTIVDSGTINAVDGELVITTGVVANSSAKIQSINRAIFNAATYNKAHQAVRTPNFDNPNVIRRWGMFDPAVLIYSGDGVFWENNSGVYSIKRMKGGVIEEDVAEIDFNGGNTLLKDNNLRQYEIIYNAGSLLFMQNRKLIHKMSSLVGVAYTTVHLPVGASIENINGNTVDNNLLTRGFACSRIGSPASIPDKFLIDGNGAAVGLVENTPAVFKKIIIGDVGNGGAAVTFYDWNDLNPPASSKILTVNMTEGIKTIDMDFILNRGLVYSRAGTGFEVLVVTA